MGSPDVQVVGTGIVGHALALSLARLGLQVALHSGAARPPDTADRVSDVRAYALNPASVALLTRLKVWDALPPRAATAVHDMQVHGDAGGAARLEFSAWDARVGELAWITDAAVLERQLRAATAFSPHVTMVDADPAPAAAGADDGFGGVGAGAAPLTAYCDGRASSAGAAVGVRVARHAYGQCAIAARLVASEGHRHTARQWFGAPDVLALLPFDAPEPGRSFACVWSLPDARAEALLAADDAAFEAALTEATSGSAGTLRLAAPRQSWSLQVARAEAWSGPGWVLLGDAAHVVHPLAGQGLNLGLADVAALARVISDREPWRALGDARLLRRYGRERAAPTWAMRQATDGLLQAFADPAPLARELRNRGLTLVDRLTPIKRWLTARALDT